MEVAKRLIYFFINKLVVYASYLTYHLILKNSQETTSLLLVYHVSQTGITKEVPDNFHDFIWI